MYFYRQSIILFGLIVPFVITVAVIGLGYLAVTNMNESFQNKEKTFETSEKARKEALSIETSIVRQRVHLERWKEQLSMETASAVATNLREISDKLPNKEIQQTSFERPSNKSGFGGASAQNSAQLRIAFRGTYRTLQKAFFELETRMPQLQLEDLKMEPIGTSSSLLNFQVSYTAWEN
jgi:hypothetical protein